MSRPPTLNSVTAQPLPGGNAEWLTLFFDSAPMATCITAPDGRLLRVNDAFCAMLGMTPEEVTGKSFVTLTHPDDVAVSLAFARDTLAGPDDAGTFEKRYLARGGRVVWARLWSRLHRDATGAPLFFVTHVEDVTDGRRLHDALREAYDDARLRTRALDAAANAVVITDRHGTIRWVNHAFTTLTGYSAQEAVGGKPSLLKSSRHTAAFYARMWGTIMAGAVWSGLLVNRRKDGSLYDEEMTVTPVRDDQGAISHFIAIKQDVTQRIQAEAAIRASEERFRDLAENITQVFFAVDPDSGLCQYVSRAYETLWGRPRSHASAAPLSWMDAIHPDDVARIRGSARAVVQGLSHDSADFRIVQPDGTIRWARGRVQPIRDPEGRVTRLFGVVEDITELRQKEAQLLHAQKLEAVGRLAGGVAHDFNNLLTIIQSYGEMLAADLPPSDRRTEDLSQILAAAKRAQGLTRQLLAFSRQQVLQPVTVDARDLVAGVNKMLRRLIGEDIALDLQLGASPGNVHVDPGQFEQVLMNLAVNARDAMPRGGRLGISVSTIAVDDDTAALYELPRPGNYVTVAVTDNGTGMTPEVRARIFEPFFTTKESGRGTGLGLATVYGIVRQSGGTVTVDSEPGQGSVFRVYLPALAAVAATERAPEEGPPPQGSETVLVTEDDPFLRTAAAEILTRNGYTVLTARHGEEALARASSHGHLISLLLSDVVMPGMNGGTLAARMRERHPDIRVLLTSGYTGDAMVRRGIVDSGVPFIEKPFTTSGLLWKVREVLDG